MTAASAEAPYGCSWCGDEARHHGSQWAPVIGFHQWIEPDQVLVLDRMIRRRAARLAAMPEKFHATTGWAPGPDGESADPYCADCGDEGCPRWWRVHYRLWGIPRRTPQRTGGWDDGATRPELTHDDEPHHRRDHLVINKGDEYVSLNPRVNPPVRIRVVGEPRGTWGMYGYGKVDVATVAAAGREIRRRAIDVRQLHDSATTQDGMPRRTGYARVKEAGE